MQMQYAMIVLLEQKKNPTLNVVSVFQANIVWRVHNLCIKTMNVKSVKTENLQQTMEEVLFAVIVLLAKKKKVILNVRYVEVVITVQKHPTMNVTNVMQVNLVNLFFGHLVSKNNLLLEMLVQL